MKRFFFVLKLINASFLVGLVSGVLLSSKTIRNKLVNLKEEFLCNSH